MSIGEMVGLVFGLLGVVIGGVSWRDARKQKSVRERSVNCSRELIGRLQGTLISIKPAFADNSREINVINDALEAIKIAKPGIDGL